MQASTTTTCPVCLGSSGVQCTEFATPRDSTGFECQACGRFEISRTALVTYFDSRRGTLSALQRATLSHRLSTVDRGSSGGLIDVARNGVQVGVAMRTARCGQRKFAEFSRRP